MIELRADGSVPGKAKLGRVYLMQEMDTGSLFYSYCSGEYDSDVEQVVKQIEHRKGFIQWSTDVIPVDKLSETARMLTVAGMPKDIEERCMREVKRDAMLKKINEAEKASYEYFQLCDVGPERTKAYNIYENIRNSLRNV